MKSTICVVITLLTLPVAGCGDTESATRAAPESGHDEEGHQGESGHVKLTPAQIQSAGIGTAQAGPATIRERLPLYGVIAPNAERVREVAARFPGAIRSVT